MSEDLRKIWHLSGQLSSQLSRNQRHLDELKRRIESIDDAAEEVVEDTLLPPQHVLAEDNARLRVRNRVLDDEARDLAALVREYDKALDAVMDKFRKLSGAVQATVSGLKREHSAALLREVRHREAVEQQLDAVRARAVHLGELLRRTLGSLNPDIDELSVNAPEPVEVELVRLRTENAMLRDMFVDESRIRELVMNIPAAEMLADGADSTSMLDVSARITPSSGIISNDVSRITDSDDTMLVRNVPRCSTPLDGTSSGSGSETEIWLSPASPLQAPCPLGFGEDVTVMLSPRAARRRVASSGSVSAEGGSASSGHSPHGLPQRRKLSRSRSSDLRQANDSPLSSNRDLGGAWRAYFDNSMQEGESSSLAHEQNLGYATTSSPPTPDMDLILEDVGFVIKSSTPPTSPRGDAMSRVGEASAGVETENDLGDEFVAGFLCNTLPMSENPAPLSVLMMTDEPMAMTVGEIDPSQIAWQPSHIDKYADEGDGLAGMLAGMGQGADMPGEVATTHESFFARGADVVGLEEVEPGSVSPQLPGAQITVSEMADDDASPLASATALEPVAGNKAGQPGGGQSGGRKKKRRGKGAHRNAS